MTPPDIVTLLNTWLHECELAGAEPSCVLIRRARDEIVMLRELVADEADRSQEFADHIHDEAMEQAARIALEFAEPEITDNKRKNECRMFAARIAAAIRGEF